MAARKSRDIEKRSLDSKTKYAPCQRGHLSMTPCSARHASSKLAWPQRSCLLISIYGLAPGRVGGPAPPLRLAIANCLVDDRAPVRQTLDSDLCGSTEYVVRTEYIH